MSVVFNLANTKTSTIATGPCVRILGLNLSFNEASALSKGRDIETRVWPMSEAQDIKWKPLTNVNVSILEDNKYTQQCTAEYESIEKRFNTWTSWRDKITEEVNSAARNHIMRPVNQIRAHFLLSLQPLLTPEPLPEPLLEKQKALKEPLVVSGVARNDEIRGQTWALIGICGDALYEESKHELLEALGSSYFQYIQSIHPTASVEEAERLFMESGQQGQTDLYNAIGEDIETTRKKLMELSKEPMVAFFDVSDDPETLETASASIIAKNSNLKHIDLAIVRLYSWIRLDYVPKKPKSHTYRDPKANSFYQNLTAAL